MNNQRRSDDLEDDLPELPGLQEIPEEDKERVFPIISIITEKLDEDNLPGSKPLSPEIGYRNNIEDTEYTAQIPPTMNS